MFGKVNLNSLEIYINLNVKNVKMLAVGNIIEVYHYIHVFSIKINKTCI